MSSLVGPRWSVALSLAALILGALATSGTAEETKATGEGAAPVKTEPATATVTTPAPVKTEPAPAAATTSVKEGSNPKPMAGDVAVIETSMGTIKIKLFTDIAPKAVENFEGLARKKYYEGIIFHRVMDGFMIQGGDPTGTGSGGASFWGGTFEDEFSPKVRFDRKGLLAMANRGPKTNGSQFFITLAPTAWLNDKHTIFGEVVAGMDVVEKIGKTPTSKPSDKPITPVTMKKVTIEAAKKG